MQQRTLMEAVPCTSHPEAQQALKRCASSAQCSNRCDAAASEGVCCNHTVQQSKLHCLHMPSTAAGSTHTLQGPSSSETHALVTSTHTAQSMECPAHRRLADAGTPHPLPEAQVKLLMMHAGTSCRCQCPFAYGHPITQPSPTQPNPVQQK